MISILAQERLLGAALGCAVAGAFVFYERCEVSRLASEFAAASRPPSGEMEVPEITPSRKSEFAHTWNKTVDYTLGSLVQALSSRGW